MDRKFVPADAHAQLRRIHMLNSLESSALRSLATACHWRTYTPGQQIISPASKDRHVYLIVSGNVRVALFSAGGKEVAFRDISAGKAFGEISAIDGQPRSANVEALERCTVAAIPPEAFCELMEKHPSVMRYVVHELASTIRSLSERLFELSTLGIQNRVHAEVLRLAKQTGATHGEAVIDPAPRHIDIASRISANREQVTKELSAMTRRGLLTKSGRALVVPDIARLERLVAEVRRST